MGLSYLVPVHGLVLKTKLSARSRLCRGLLTGLLLAIGIAGHAQPGLRDTLLTGHTRTALTPLYYGLGTDRLGGARLETLDSGVVLQLTGLDSSRRFWRVRLAPSLSAFVPTEQVQIDSNRAYPAGSLTGNWTVYGDTTRPTTGPTFDYVAIRLPARLPYRSQLTGTPSKLLIDVFGVTANTNWITQRRTTREIRQVSFEQLADDIVRITVELTHPQSWGYALTYQRNTLLIRVRRPPARRRLRGLTVAVDAGHGGSNTGAAGTRTGLLEKNLTLDVAHRLEQQLSRRGVRVLLVRQTDTLLGPSARMLAMRRAMPDLLVSLHFNSSDNRSVRGVSTYYKHAGFRSLSQAILAELTRYPVPEFGNVGHFNFFFNTPTEYPNALVEGPFLSNEADERLIESARFRGQMATAIRRGIRRFVGKRQPAYR